MTSSPGRSSADIRPRALLNATDVFDPGTRARSTVTIQRTSSNLIGGVAGTGTGPEQSVIDPSTGRVIWRYAADEAASVDAAVAAAAAAYPEWSRATPAERSGALVALAAHLEEMAEDLAQAETAQTGKPIRLAREFDVPGSIDNVAFFAGAARRLDGHASAEYSGDHTSTIRREPIGVVGSIAPWNYPLQMAMWKVLPAIAAGNTIVLKAAENTPLTTLMLADACTAVGIPAGVVNVVNGPGPLTGEALVTHPVIAMTSFTGSTVVGRHIAALAAGNGTRLHLELGGKAPFVVFDDADLPAAIRGAVAASLINTGQDCTAATRAYVHRSVYDDFVDGVADLRPDHRPGAAGVVQAARQGRRHGRARGRGRGEGRHRGYGAGRGPGVRCLLRAHAARRRRAGQRDRAAGDLRPGAGGAAVRLRRGGDPPRQRRALRARRLGVDP
jgi:betaine-aldehyde dehydrogenase